MKKGLCLVLTVIMMLGIFTSVPVSITAKAATVYESEANDSYETADAVTLGNTISGVINNKHDCDFYKITAPANGKITINFLHTYSEGSYTKSWVVKVYQYTNGSYTELSHRNISSTDNEKISLPYIGAVKNGVYYVKVASYDAYEYIVGENYKISTTFTKSDYFEKEENASYASANPVTLGKTYSGNINNKHDCDFYKITAPANGKITLNFLHTYSEGSYTKSWVVKVYQYTNGSYTELSHRNISSTDNEKISLPYIGAVKNGVYYVKVASYDAYEYIVGENYKISTTFTKSDYFEKEVNASYASANPVTLGKTYSGNINNKHDCDFYKITAPANGKITLNFYHSQSEGSYTKSWEVWIYQYTNGSYKELSYNSICCSDNENISLPYISAVKNGVYYVKVASYDAYEYIVGENYKIKASFYIPTPKLTAIANTASGVKVTWSKVSGADSYIVYRKTYDEKTKTWGSWTKLTSVTGTSYLDKTTKTGTYYRYTVKATNKVGVSGYNTSGIKTYFLATPKVTSTSNTTNSITVKWGKVVGASGYYVYRKTGNGSWQKIAAVKGGSKVSFTDTKAKAGVTYRYTVKAYYGSYVSAYNTNGYAVRRLLTPSLKSVSSSKSGVTFTWNKVTGATGYNVYRKTGSGSWQKIATDKGNSYLDKTAKKGVTYTYTVRAYYGTSTSAYNTKGLTIKDKY